jgi:hypothetical protein
MKDISFLGASLPVLSEQLPATPKHPSPTAPAYALLGHACVRAARSILHDARHPRDALSVRESVVRVTKRGRPVAEVVPVEQPAERPFVVASFIVATALVEGVKLVTKDGRITDSGIVPVVR